VIFDPKWRPSGLLEAVFEELSDSMLVYGPDMKIIAANHAAEKVFGPIDCETRCSDLLLCYGACNSECLFRQGLLKPFLPGRRAPVHSETSQERAAVFSTTQVRDMSGELLGVLVTVKDVMEEAGATKRALIAESQAMKELLKLVVRIAASEATSILIEGENGAGKDLIAATLHDQSPRRSEPFLAINCAAIPDSLLESELFGYEKGAFTDARAQKRGLLELADGGTLFLNEIGEIPLSLQAKLLHVMEEQTFRRLGGLHNVKVNVRILSATNKNLREAVQAGAFRKDLYYRLNVIQLVVPPLRERPDDIAPLANHFVDHFNRRFKRQLQGVSAEALELLMTHDWPGNVRELRNAIERAMVLEETDWITSDSLFLTGSKIRTVTASSAPQTGASSMSFLDQQRRLVIQALDKSKGNQTQAARLLGIGRDSLRYKIKKFKLRAITAAVA
jgi:transcriptional regulator with PAS, ATPase and Fis domain